MAKSTPTPKSSAKKPATPASKSKPKAAAAKPPAKAEKPKAAPAKPEAKPAAGKPAKPAAPAKQVAKPAAESKGKPAAAKPEVKPTKVVAVEAKPDAKGKTAAGGKPTGKGGKAAEPPSKPAQRFVSPFSGSMTDAKAAAAKLSAAAGLTAIRKQSINGETLRPEEGPQLKKSPFNKKQLTEFRDMLLVKRAQIAGDVNSMESEALTGGSGSLSHLPQHTADQGSDTYDQTLNLDLAAQQRKLLREIDDALTRIDAGTYGICELLGRPIGEERLRYTPWARHSIEAARQLERMPYSPPLY
ncbi:MAG: TraR/DksA family transcriptional regulator [Phycisphaerales bacterium]|nr:TraR/DksA family transcriptional regulator [Phycisphaerales bacterium]